MLTDLRLPTIKRLAGDLCAQSDLEGWPAHRFLEALLEHEINERERKAHGPPSPRFGAGAGQAAVEL